MSCQHAKNTHRRELIPLSSSTNICRLLLQELLLSPILFQTATQLGESLQMRMTLCYFDCLQGCLAKEWWGVQFSTPPQCLKMVPRVSFLIEPEKTWNSSLLKTLLPKLKFLEILLKCVDMKTVRKKSKAVFLCKKRIKVTQTVKNVARISMFIVLLVIFKDCGLPLLFSIIMVCFIMIDGTKSLLPVVRVDQEQEEEVCDLDFLIRVTNLNWVLLLLCCHLGWRLRFCAVSSAKSSQLSISSSHDQWAFYPSLPSIIGHWCQISPD